MIIHDLNVNDVGTYSCEATIELTEFNTYSIFSKTSYVLNLLNPLYPLLNDITSNGETMRARNDELNFKLECKFQNYQKIEWIFKESLKNSTL